MEYVFSKSVLNKRAFYGGTDSGSFQPKEREEETKFCISTVLGAFDFLEANCLING